ncbi:MAG: hypothetical protein FJW96_06240 [Actinobacteria bacterium]|nr:hypothetical protein [Actinomycetota bacterium]
MSEYLKAFTLGNAAILGNVCVLPLYPGFLVMLANRARDRGEAGGGIPRLAGLLVFAGILTVMTGMGFLLHALDRSVADILGWLLPVLYGAVLLLGIAMLLRRNPFARLGSTRVPLLRSTGATAYVYGMLLAPMTLPCTGPLVVSAFVIGSVSGTGALLDSLLYVAFFTAGFGWPLAVLPLLAVPVQRTVTVFLARRHRLVEVVSGLLLVGIAALGLWADVRPSLA